MRKVCLHLSPLVRHASFVVVGKTIIHIVKDETIQISSSAINTFHTGSELLKINQVVCVKISKSKTPINFASNLVTDSPYQNA